MQNTINLATKKLHCKLLFSSGILTVHKYYIQRCLGHKICTQGLSNKKLRYYQLVAGNSACPPRRRCIYIPNYRLKSPSTADKFWSLLNFVVSKYLHGIPIMTFYLLECTE